MRAGGCIPGSLPRRGRREGRLRVDEPFAPHLQHNSDRQGEGKVREASGAGGGEELSWPETGRNTGSKKEGLSRDGGGRAVFQAGGAQV